MKAQSEILMILVVVALFHTAVLRAGAQTPVSIEDAKLHPTDAGPFDFFFVIGEKPLSISADSNTLLIGAALADIGPNDKQGAAYLFERAPGGQFDSAAFTKLIAPDGLANDQFGRGAALSPDGNTAAVGAFQPIAATATNLDKGAVYIFERNMGGPDNWGFSKKITGPEVPSEPMVTPIKPRNSEFGGNLQFSSDGDTLIVGDPDAFLLPDNSESNRGVAYIFDRNADGPDNWGFIQRLEDPDGSNSHTFGSAVALDTDTAVVGALFGGAAYIFDRDNGGPNNWGLTKKLDLPVGSAFFGQSVALTTDGDTAAVSASGSPNPGSVFIFERDSGGANMWGQSKEILAEGGEVGDAFGEHIDFSRTDNGSLIVGAVFSSVNGAFNQGAAYFFERDEGGDDNWGQVKKLLASDHADLELFGFAVARAGDTSVVVDEDGVAYIFGPEKFRPDQWIGARRARQKGNNIYNFAGGGQTEKVFFKRGRAAKFFTTLQNDGNTTDLIRMEGNLGTRKINTVYKQIAPAGGNVTGAIRSGNFQINVHPGRTVVFKVTQKPRKKNARHTFRISAKSQKNLLLADLIKEIAKSKN